jgi:hypothetical protein
MKTTSSQPDDKTRIQIKYPAIECGEFTCVDDMGEPCKWLGTANYGTAHCLLFQQHLYNNVRGPVQRCRRCLKLKTAVDQVVR